MIWETIQQQLIQYVLSVISLIVTSVILPCVFELIKTRINNEKLEAATEELGDSVISAVECVNQTFVNVLKSEGKFDDQAQREAMLRSITYAAETISDSTKNFIESQGVELQTVLEKRIEAYLGMKKEDK